MTLSTKPLDRTRLKRWVAVLGLMSVMSLLSPLFVHGEAAAQTSPISPDLKWITGFRLGNPAANQPARAWQNTDIIHSVSIRRFGGYRGVPTLELLGAPAGLVIVPLPNSALSDRMNFFVHADATTPAGWYSTQLRGRDGNYNSTVPFPIFVGVPGEHTIASTQSSVSSAPGQVADIVFQVTPAVGAPIPDVNLSLYNLPPGSTFIQVQSADLIWVKLTIAANTSSGSIHTVRIVSNSGVHFADNTFTLRL